MRAWISLILLVNQVAAAQDAGVHVRLVATHLWDVKAVGSVGVGYDGRDPKTRQVIAKVSGEGCDFWSAWRGDGGWNEERFTLATRRDCELDFFRYGAPKPEAVGVRIPGQAAMVVFEGPQWVATVREDMGRPPAQTEAPHWEEVATPMVHKACRSVPHDRVCHPPPETLERAINQASLESQRVGGGTWTRISFGVRWVARGQAKYVVPPCGQSRAPEGWHRDRPSDQRGVLVVHLVALDETVEFPEIPLAPGDELVLVDLSFNRVQIATHHQVVGGGPIRLAEFEFSEPP